jgi:hypothetical protein
MLDLQSLHEELLHLIQRYREQGFSIFYLARLLREWLDQEERKLQKPTYDVHREHLTVEWTEPSSFTQSTLT